MQRENWTVGMQHVHLERLHYSYTVLGYPTYKWGWFCWGGQRWQSDTEPKKAAWRSMHCAAISTNIWLIIWSKETDGGRDISSSVPFYLFFITLPTIAVPTFANGWYWQYSTVDMHTRRKCLWRPADFTPCITSSASCREEENKMKY